MKFILSILFFCLFLFSLNCQSAQNNIELSVPLVINDNRPFIVVKIKNEVFHFVVDTGGYNLIEMDAARKLGLELTNQSQTSGAGEQRVDAWTTTVDAYSLGGKTFTNQRFNVVSLKNIKEGLGLPYLDGIIGYDFFRDSVLQFDYPNKKVNFLKSYEGKNGIPFTIYNGHIPKFKVEIDGIESEFIFDSGDRSQLTLSKHFAEKLFEKSRYNLSEERITGYGIGGPITAKTFELKNLRFGAVEVANILTRIPTIKSGAFTQSDFTGSIGNALLLKYKVTIDYPKKLIYFE